MKGYGIFVLKVASKRFIIPSVKTGPALNKARSRQKCVSEVNGNDYHLHMLTTTSSALIEIY